jgi:ubiquinone/menaquinone biosynthesis C-methylase UbiE
MRPARAVLDYTEPMLPAVDYNNRLHRGYHQGRDLSRAALHSWRTAMLRRLPPKRPLTVAELGSGTGRFTGVIADIGTGPVYAVEPSHRMRETAAAQHPHAAVHWIGGRAEGIPLAAASCDVVAMFFVMHHIIDLRTATQEIARVLRPGGRLLIAGSFSERLHPRVYYDYMPRSREIEAQLFPTLAATEEVFGKAGLTTIGFDEVEHEVSYSLTAYSARLAHRAVSTFEHLTDKEVAQGLARLAADADAETAPHPVRHTHDLVTLQRSS